MSISQHAIAEQDDLHFTRSRIITPGLPRFANHPSHHVDVIGLHCGKKRVAKDVSFEY